MATKIDANQVLKAAFDDVSQRLRVDSLMSPAGGSTEVTIDHTDDSIKLGDGTTLYTGTTVGAKHGLDVNIIGGASLSVNLDHTSDSINLGDGTTLYTGTTVGSDHGLDVNIIGGIVSGTFTPSGLSTGLKAQKIPVTSTPVKVPTTPLTDRNGITIRVWGANPVFFDGSNSVSSTTGYPKTYLEEIVMDATDDPNVEVWAVCESGKTSELRVLEIA